MGALASALGRDRICCLTSRDDCKNLFGSDGPRIYCWKRGVRNVVGALSFGGTIAQIIVRERARAVLLATVGDGSVALWLNQWFKLPFVVFAHGNEILVAMRNDSSTETFIATLRRADRVLAVSQFTANLVAQAGIPPNRIEIIHPGCDTNRFRPLPPSDELKTRLLGNRAGDRVIVTVGNLVQRKGQDMVIRSLPLIRQSNPEITYLIVGDGPYRPELEKLAGAMGVKDRVIFAGRVAADDLPDIYALSDVFVMPSRERLDSDDVEGFGLVFLEASACAKPVVGSWSGGVPDAVVDGVTGLLVNPQDPEEIAKALSRLLLERDFAIQLGRQGRSRVVSEFNWAYVADRVQGVLGGVVREKSSRR